MNPEIQKIIDVAVAAAAAEPNNHFKSDLPNIVSKGFSQKLTGLQEFNILIGVTEEGDKELFFGPLSPEDEFIELPADVRWPQLLVKIGMFPSLGQAKKNGWDKDIEPGFSEHKVGKRRIFILKV